MNWKICCALAVLGAFTSGSVTAQGHAAAFVDVTVLPMTSGSPLEHRTVVVQGDRITAIGDAARVVIPAGATRIDGRGRFLIPGLAEMHAHIPELGKPDDFGSVAVGKRADLVLLDADPSKDVANLTRRSGVMLRGRWLSAHDFEIGLAAIAQRSAQ